MLKSAQGVYRNGKIELNEIPDDLADDTRVIVTFLAPEMIDLGSRGIDEAHAANLRARLASFSEEWEAPEMDIYDDYDDAKSKL
jgi:hypothetical protein